MPRIQIRPNLSSENGSKSSLYIFRENVPHTHRSVFHSIKVHFYYTTTILFFSLLSEALNHLIVQGLVLWWFGSEGPYEACCSHVTGDGLIVPGP